MPPLHFAVFIAVSLVVFVGILRWVLRARLTGPPSTTVVVVALIVVVAGMSFAKFGANIGLAWQIYYGLPALITLALPPVALRMAGPEVGAYIVLALAASPIIHIFFSLFVGWSEYLPFWHIPAVWELWRADV